MRAEAGTSNSISLRTMAIVFSLNPAANYFVFTRTPAVYMYKGKAAAIVLSGDRFIGRHGPIAGQRSSLSQA